MRSFRWIAVFLLTGYSMSLLADAAIQNLSKMNWQLYPKETNIKFETDSTISADGTAFGRITIPESAQRFSVYTYIKMNENKNYTVSFRYKTKEFQIGEAGAAGVNLFFNKKNGGNGSAGAVNLPLNINGKSEDWQTFSREVQVPPDTAVCQFGIIRGSGIKGTIWFGDIKIEEIKDIFNINKIVLPPVIDGKLNDECWKKAVPLTPFYVPDNNAKTAKTGTAAFMAYDDKNIYIAFKNTEPDITKLRAQATERDGKIWNDDCNEIFIAAPDGKAFQFALNSENMQGDGKLYVRVPGDPYRSDVKWNGEWKSAVSKDKDGWTAEFCIPFSNFGMQPEADALWYVNLARERKVEMENSHFNRVDGSFNNVSKFAKLKFAKNNASLIRYSENLLEDPLLITRKTPKFKELLSEQPSNYNMYNWAREFELKSYPVSIKEKYTPETFAQEQDAALSEFGQAGISGPPFPWAATLIAGGMEKIKKLNEKYKMKFWVSIANSGVARKAIAKGALFIDKKRVDPTDPQYVKSIEKNIKEYFSANKDKLPYIDVIRGEDEPMNESFGAYSMTLHEENKEALLEIDKKIKKEFGFGKYGLYDAYSIKNDADTAPFSMIAFARWWSNTFAGSIKSQRELVKQYAPGITFEAYNLNFTKSMSEQDASLLSLHTDVVSVDPYPTSTLYNYGRERALYHTGFAVKILKDISGNKSTAGILQAYPYCGRTPLVPNLREWASQALKNGADTISWFAVNEGTPIRVTLPEIYKEMLRVNSLIHKMNQLKVPDETKTAVFFSYASFWGNFDKAAHSHYSIYSILGENLKTWFRFVSDSELKLKMDDLSKYKLIYVPQIKFTDADTADRLLEYVKNGGRLVIFDPEAFTWNIDGTTLEKIRSELIGCSTGKAVDSKNIVAATDYSGLKKGYELPLTPLTHIANAGKILAVEITPPADAEIIANYPDGKPAAFERKIGKGTVVYFAAQPFGNSDLAIKDSAWIVFMKGQAEQVGEKLDLPIWDFELPATGGEIEVKYVIKPDSK